MSDGVHPPNITTWSLSVIVRENAAQGGGLDPFIEGEDHKPRIFSSGSLLYLDTPAVVFCRCNNKNSNKLWTFQFVGQTKVHTPPKTSKVYCYWKQS